MKEFVNIKETAYPTNRWVLLPYFPTYNARVIYTKRIWNRKKEHARYTLERFPTDNARVICTKKGIGKYGIMY